MKLRLPRRRVWRALIYLFCLILVLLAIDLLLINSRRNISIGYFTTRISAPLREDGRIDYLTALETYFSQGVTPENNAAPLLLRAFGREALPQNQPDDGITDRLGMPHLPKGGDYFIRYADWCKQHSVPPEDLQVDATDAVAWPIKVSPAMVQWIKENEKPLALITEASKKPRYFIPFNGGVRTWTILEVLIPHVRYLKEVQGPLLMRAVMRLEAGDFVGFKEDVMTVHRLARLVAQAPALIERIAAITNLEIPACLVEMAAARSGTLSGKDAKALADELASLGDLPPITDAINISERYMGLDIMQSLARLSPYQAADMLNKIVDRGPRVPPLFMSLVPIPYDQTMRGINHFHDGALAAASLETYPQRMAGLRLCEDSLTPATEQNEFSKRCSGDWPAAYLLPALVQAHKRSAMAKAEANLARIALALAAFHADYANYPESLAQLAPSYLSSIPDDPFDDKPLHYSRTANGYKLYSVGPNMTDDAGKSSKPGDDIVANVP